MTDRLYSILTPLVLALISSCQQVSGIAFGVWEQKLEGESADMYFGVENVNDYPTKYSGYTGRGYADLGGSGSFVQWNVETPLNLTDFDVTADFDISVRYSSPNRRSCSLYVDDIKQGDYSIDPTGSWNAWEYSMPMSVSLEEGIHQIKIVAVGASGPNIDFLSIRARREIIIIDDDEEMDELMTKEINSSNVAEEIVDEEEESEEKEEESIPNSSNILKKDMSLSRGEFISSPNGSYKIGIVYSTGEFVIKYNSTNVITWSNGVLGGELLFMQADGNLVVRNSDFKAIWNTESSGKNGAELAIGDNGIASIVLDSIDVWTSRDQFGASYSSGFESDGSMGLGYLQIVVSNPNSRRFAEKVVLNSLEKLPRGEFVLSPDERYQIGLNDVGDLVLQDLSDQTTIWSANVEECAAATMQKDGNFVLRDGNNKLIWTTHTSKNPGARLVIDDGGRLSIMVGRTPIWMEGIPRGVYNGRSSSPSLQFPLRGIFYYPWYPETWSVNSQPAKFIPDLGKYSSDDSAVIEEHIDAMDYAYSDVAIASWWGPGTSQELSRITLLMDKTYDMKSGMKWTVYYEDEMFRNPSVEKIRSDLSYLKKWFVWHPAWAFIDDRPVIFVYNEAGCSVNERWMEASGTDWYVVMKVFRGAEDCEFQPDSYHQYGPSNAYIHIEGISASVSPGFWRADQEQPKLPRLSQEEFCENTKTMVQSGERWQLVTTFNEAGEGTLVEASSEYWGSDTKYGLYLDCLHDHH